MIPHTVTEHHQRLLFLLCLAAGNAVGQRLTDGQPMSEYSSKYLLQKKWSQSVQTEQGFPESLAD